MKVKGNHPVAEILAKKLSGIEIVPAAEQRKMVNRAIKAAVEYLKMLWVTQCPECEQNHESGMNFCANCGRQLWHKEKP